MTKADRLKEIAAELAKRDPESLTTLLIRNIPSSHRQTQLVELLNAGALEGCYDFVYMPINFKSGSNLGYAFINFTCRGHAERVMDALDGTMWSEDSDEACSVSWASPNQGLEEHVERYRNS